jgi:hypothetical protein
MRDGSVGSAVAATGKTGAEIGEVVAKDDTIELLRPEVAGALTAEAAPKVGCGSRV